MFEVVISSVITGRVVRRFFATSEQADRFIDRFFDEVTGFLPRSRRNYRVEVYARPLPIQAAAGGPKARPLAPSAA
jgi:hypothetical protein